jgi:hypothetical protein
LQAVIEEIEKHGIHERVCLGNIVGYVLDPGAPSVRFSHQRKE